MRGTTIDSEEKHFMDVTRVLEENERHDDKKDIVDSDEDEEKKSIVKKLKYQIK